jgi:exoribonuclease-2
MAPGNVVEYLEGKDLALAFCVAAEVKGKLGILTSSGRKESLATKKVLFSHSSPLSASASREEVLDLLRAAEKQRQDGSEELDLEELWELIQEEGEERDWSLEELTAFLFSDHVGELQKSLAYRALNESRTYFWRKAESFRIRTREQVEEALTRQRIEAKRELERAALRDWLRAVWDKGPTEPPEDYRAYIEEWTGKIRDAAIWGEKSSHHGHVQRLLKDLDNKTKEPAFHFLVRLGEWTNDQNLDLMINETPLEFPPEVVEAAESARAMLQACLADPEREDLTDWPCFTIDDPDTTEVDDALAFREVEGGFELGIHIADASALLVPELDVLEREIRERATSVYLPDLKVRMVPAALSDDMLSLIAGVERLAFSFLVRLDSEGALVSSRMAATRVKVTERFDYDSVDALVAEGDPYWQQLAGLAEKLKALREAKGALNLPFPRMDVRLDGGKISLVPDERESIAQTIVSEAMIMANRVAADYTAEHGLPAIYRGQKAPDPPVEKRAVWMPHHLFEVRKGFARSSQGLEPCPHAGLGLDRYIQATSPIRRYRDLVHQRQIKHHLKTGEVLYDAESMEQILTHTSTPVSAAEKMERNRRAYFLHKYLKGQRGQELEAVVLGSTADRYVLQLCESLREVEVPHGSGGLKAPGDKVRVKLLSVYPRDRVVKVTSPL